MRVAPLPHGAELWVGRFLVGCTYTAAGVAPAVGRAVLHTPPAPLYSNGPGSAAVLRPTPARPAPVIPEDEVPLGLPPPPDPAAGLPSSHIMADAFRALGELGLGKLAGPVSNPILLSGSNPIPATVPVPLVRPDTPAAAYSPPAPLSPDPSSFPGGAGSGVEAVVGLLLRQLGEIHSQMFEQFQQSLLLMMQVFGKMHREQVSALQQELTRIQDLNGELGRLQGEVARLTIARAADQRRAVAESTAGPHETVPMFELPPAHAAEADAGAAIQDWVVERINALQQERQARWDKLVGHFTESGRRGA
jgi:hypothetical protein